MTKKLFFNAVNSTGGRSRIQWVAAGLLFVLGLSPSQADHPPATILPSGKVDVVVRQHEGVLEFRIKNSSTAQITATLSLDAENLTYSHELPYTATFPPGKETTAFTAQATDPTRPWKYDYSLNFTVGSHVAVHDDSVVYRLPYADGKSYRVSQGYNGRFSHTGPDQYSIDWGMPQGTAVLCARDGVVEQVKDHSHKGGAKREYIEHCNVILVRHADDTVANYAHLRQGSARVLVGQKVRAGDYLAQSGNTGFSSGPHLHFSVFKTRNGSERQTLPVRFQTRHGSLEISSGKTYQAVPLPQPALAQESKDGLRKS